MKNKDFANEFISLSKGMINKLDSIDPESETASIEIAKIDSMLNAIKQANNTFRSCLQHDIAKANNKEYASSFLDD